MRTILAGLANRDPRFGWKPYLDGLAVFSKEPWTPPNRFRGIPVPLRRGGHFPMGSIEA